MNFLKKRTQLAKESSSNFSNFLPQIQDFDYNTHDAQSENNQDQNTFMIKSSECPPGVEIDEKIIISDKCKNIDFTAEKFMKISLDDNTQSQANILEIIENKNEKNKSNFFIENYQLYSQKRQLDLENRLESEFADSKQSQVSSIFNIQGEIEQEIPNFIEISSNKIDKKCLIQKQTQITNYFKRPKEVKHQVRQVESVRSPNVKFINSKRQQFLNNHHKFSFSTTTSSPIIQTYFEYIDKNQIQKIEYYPKPPSNRIKTRSRKEQNQTKIDHKNQIRLLKTNYQKLVSKPSGTPCTSPKQTLIEYYSDSSSAKYFNVFDERDLPHHDWLKRKSKKVEQVEFDVDSKESELWRAKQMLMQDLGEAITCYQENIELGLLLVTNLED